MTREQAIANLECQTDLGYGIVIEGDTKDIRNALDMAIHALEQTQSQDCNTCKHKGKEWDEEPCDDCCGNNNGYEPQDGDLISRQDAIAEIYEDFMTIDMAVHNKSAQRCMDILGKLPSVSQPQGHWIEEFNDIENEVRFYCSKCNKWEYFKSDFCPNCGAKMERREDD